MNQEVKVTSLVSGDSLNEQHFLKAQSGNEIDEVTTSDVEEDLDFQDYDWSSQEESQTLAEGSEAEEAILAQDGSGQELGCDPFGNIRCWHWWVPFFSCPPCPE